jgi:ribose/xylose/arabinose/galactoside ABC-type transport system permease subunit
LTFRTLTVLPAAPKQAYQAMGDPLLLPAIAAIVVGGISIQGGRRALSSVMMAVVFMTLLTSLPSAKQISDARRQVIYGPVILAAPIVYGRLGPDQARRRPSASKDTRETQNKRQGRET